MFYALLIYSFDTWPHPGLSVSAIYLCRTATLVRRTALQLRRTVRWPHPLVGWPCPRLPVKPQNRVHNFVASPALSNRAYVPTIVLFSALFIVRAVRPSGVGCPWVIRPSGCPPIFRTNSPIRLVRRTSSHRTMACRA